MRGSGKKDRIVFYQLYPKEVVFVNGPSCNGEPSIVELEGYTGEWALNKIKMIVKEYGRLW
jgi:hypothetical protein